MASSRRIVPPGTTATSANNHSVPCAPKSQSRIRTNIVLLKPIRFYIPDDDDSVPYAFMLGRHTIATAKGCEQALLSGYFSTLCAVLQDLTNIAKKIMRNLAFQVEEIAVPSQADSMGIAIPQSQDLKLEIIRLGQVLFLPFQNKFFSDFNEFWKAVANDAGVMDLSSSMMCSVGDMKTISSALLVSGLKGEVQSSIASSIERIGCHKVTI